jgi:hypothetical protein
LQQQQQQQQHAGDAAHIVQEQHSQQQSSPAAASSAAAAAVHKLALSSAALNFDNTPTEPFAATQLQQQQQQQQQPDLQPNQPLRGSPESALAAAAAAAAATAFQRNALQLTLSSFSQQPPAESHAFEANASRAAVLPPSSSSSSSSSSSAQEPLQVLLQLIVSNPERLLPWQLQPQPTAQQLQQHERLKLSGSQKGCRISGEAFDQMLVLLRRFCQSRALVQQARSAHVPKAVRTT